MLCSLCPASVRHDVVPSAADGREPRRFQPWQCISHASRGPENTSLMGTPKNVECQTDQNIEKQTKRKTQKAVALHTFGVEVHAVSEAQ